VVVRLAKEEADNDHGHVVAADAESVRRLGKALGHQLLADGGEGNAIRNPRADKVYDLLVGHAVPNALFHGV